MDNCFTCQDRSICPMYDEYGTIEGCFNWKPVDRLENKDLDTASVIMLWLVVSIPVWILIIWLFIR